MKTMLSRFALILAASVFTGHALAADTYTVEEDWELHLDTPNLTKNTPQWLTHFRIDGDTFILTTFNYREFPAHDPGGIQMQLWDAGNLVDTVDVTLNSLDVSGDVVKWTHVYTIKGGKTLEMKLTGVSSQTWGEKIINENIIQDPASVSTFNTYDSANSIAESHINYGRNAVLWFGITKTTSYDDHARPIRSDSTPRVVYAR